MAQVQIRYDGKVLLPVSTLAFKRAIERSADGTARRHFWQISMGGVLLPWKGSPLSNGTFYTSSGYPADESGTFANAWESLQKKKEALAGLFRLTGKKLETIPVGGTTRTCRPRWNEVEFTANGELNHLPWNVVGEADYVDGLDGGNLPVQADSLPEETWVLERADEVGRQYRLTHTVSSQQKGRFDLSAGTETSGWQVAKDFILGTGLAGGGAASKLGFDAAQVSGSVLTDLSGFARFNYKRQQTADEAQGRFTVVEAWELFNNSDSPSGVTAGNALEELTVEDRFDIGSGLNTVTVSVTVTGHEERGDDYVVTKTRSQNMQDRMGGLTSSVLLDVAEEATGLTLNPVASSATVSQNRSLGRGQVTATYDTRPANDLTSPLVLSEIITLEIDTPVTVRPEIPVPYRSAGPVVQNASTLTQGTVSVTAELKLRVAYGVAPVAPVVNTLPYVSAVLGYTPSSIWVKRDTPRWTPKTGSYTRTVVYGFQ